MASLVRAGDFSEHAAPVFETFTAKCRGRIVRRLRLDCQFIPGGYRVRPPSYVLAATTARKSRLRSEQISWAAFLPGAIDTPGPGWLPDPQR